MEKELKATGYICGTDLTCEMQEPAMLGVCQITPNLEYAKKEFECSDECGLAEVEVRFVRWVITPMTVQQIVEKSKGA